MPSTVPVSVIESIPAALAIPKSATRSSPRSFRSRFAGFTSRCTIPCRCAASRAGAACSSQASARAGGWAPSRAQAVLERAAGEVLHHDERPAFPFADVEDRDRSGLAGEARGGQRLALEALADPFVGGVAVGQHLDRDLAPEQLVGGEVDVAHRAAAEPPRGAVAGRQQLGVDGHRDPIPRKGRTKTGHASRKDLQRPLPSGCPAAASGQDPSRRRAGLEPMVSTFAAALLAALGLAGPRERTRRRRRARPSSSPATAGATASGSRSTAPTATRCTAGRRPTSSPTTTPAPTSARRPVKRVRVLLVPGSKTRRRLLALAVHGQGRRPARRASCRPASSSSAPG